MSAIHKRFINQVFFGIVRNHTFGITLSNVDSCDQLLFVIGSERFY